MGRRGAGLGLFLKAATTVMLGYWLTSCAGDIKGAETYGGTAATSAPLGSTRNLGWTKIPLPPGQWVDLASIELPADCCGSNKPSLFASWGLIENGRIAVIAYSSINRDYDNAGWHLNDNCVRIAGARQQSVFFQTIGSNQPNKGDCLVVMYTRNAPPTRTSAPWYQPMWDACSKYGGIPSDSISLWFASVSNKGWENLEIRYFPERDNADLGIWAPGQETPQQKEYITSLVKWGRGFRHWVIDGASGDL